MADRDYFDMRYAIPGFAFLLVVITMNYVPILNTIRDVPIGTAFTALLAFVSVLSGSAIGFLISQVWFIWHNGPGGILNLETLKGTRDKLIDDFNLNMPKKEFPKWKIWKIQIQKIGVPKRQYWEDNRKLDVLMTCLLHKRENTETNRYIQRRLDIYQTLSCIALSIGSGIIIGFTMRALYEYRVLKHVFDFGSVFSTSEFYVVGFITMLQFVALLVAFFGRRFPLKNYNCMLTIVIQEYQNNLFWKREVLENLSRSLPSKSSNVLMEDRRY